MKTKTEIKTEIKRIYQLKKLNHSFPKEQREKPDAIMDAEIMALKWALGYKVSVDYYFCMSCQIRHKGKGCPKCGNELVIGELENK